MEEANRRIECWVNDGDVDKHLDLENLGLTSLPERLFELTNLKELYLGDNDLTELPEHIGNLSSLKLLDLSDNNLTSLPESFGKLVNLLLYKFNSFKEES